MCGRYALVTPADVLVKLLEIAPPPLGLIARYNIAPGQLAAVVRCTRDGTRQLEMKRWGLVPRWADDPKLGYKMINARSESAADKPAFRWAFRHRRCVVPADGFFEWQKLPRSKKQPYFIHRRDRQPMFMAGLWERWRGAEGDEALETFTILTTAANESVRPLHDRMPVMLPLDRVGEWLDPSSQDPVVLKPMLRPAPDEQVSLFPVSTRVNTPANDDNAILTPAELIDAADDLPDDQPLLFGEDGGHCTG